MNAPIDFVNRANDQLQRSWEITEPEIAKYLEQAESKIHKGSNQKDTHHHDDNATHNPAFRKDYATVIAILLPINPLLEDLFVKVRTNIAYSDEVPAFVDSILEIGQQ